MKQNVKDAVSRQRDYFLTGITKNVDFRKEMLIKLRQAIRRFQAPLSKAVFKDLRKSEFEFLMTEVSLLYEELDIHHKHLTKWAKPKKVGTPFLHFKAKSAVHREPFGQVLIVSPWNYPFHLTFIPLIGAISAGNTVVLKPSLLTPNTSHVMSELITETFPPEYITLFQGNREMNAVLFQADFDLIFYTGSPTVGKVVMESAAKNLTPVILELGGKNPCIVDRDAKIDLAAKRIVWGKFMNAGQTCTAPDYLFVHRDVKDRFIRAVKNNLQKAYGNDPQKSQFSRIVNKDHTARLSKLIESGTIVAGGQVDVEDCYLAPTVIDNVSPESPLMQEEIFGPIMPIMDFQHIDTVIDYIRNQPKPLGLYLFTENKKLQKEVITKTVSGGVTINDVIMHAVNLNLPFGGVGESGMGVYHGKHSFDAFSHQKGILNKSTRIDIPMRYQPYTRDKQRLMKLFLKM